MYGSCAQSYKPLTIFYYVYNKYNNNYYWLVSQASADPMEINDIVLVFCGGENNNKKTSFLVQMEIVENDFIDLFFTSAGKLS